MKYKIERTTSFKKDFKLAQKQGMDIDALKVVINCLAEGKPLDEQYHDHELHGKYTGYRECHIESDWLLIYKHEDDVLALSLVRLGTHSRLFKK